MRVMSLLLLHVAVCASVGRVNTKWSRYQADKAYKPDKETSWPNPAAKDGWVHAHNAIRDQLDDLKQVLKKIKGRPLEEWEKTSIKTWFAAHYEMVHAHHSNEDVHFTPFLETRIKYPPKLTSDHTFLVKLLEKINKHISDGSYTRADKLRGMWETYERHMKPHLLEEEKLGLPLLRAYFAPEEVAPVIQKIVAAEPAIAMGAFIHSIGGKIGIQEFMAQEGIPFFVWYIDFGPSYRKYMSTVQVQIDALLSGTPPAPSQDFFRAFLYLFLCLGAILYMYLFRA